VRSVVRARPRRARTATTAHRGADLAERSPRRAWARRRRLARRSDEPAGRYGTATRRPDRNELHVPTLIDPDRRDAHVAEIGEQVAEALATSDVLLFTSRTLLRGGDADDSLAISRTVSTAVVDVVQAALAARPAWVVAKGGITSHDVAVRGLGIRRAEVVGQLLPGMVSVFRPIEAAPEAVGTPYVVFAGNVGDDNTLADVVDLFAGRR
jgi:uncharacterized protein YgbK (DUF1537 family)